MLVRVDTRMMGAGLRVADACASALADHPLSRAITGSVYLGVGAADLIRSDDPRPHVVVPLTQGDLYDAVACDQVASADAVVVTDRAELTRLHSILHHVTAIVLMGETITGHAQVIHRDNPFDEVEVDRFRERCTTVVQAIEGHGAIPPQFSPDVAANAIFEAFTAAAACQSAGTGNG